MRPLRLVMRAFGPYAGEQVIEFGVLETRSFFLIHGPTGSGKTSILDAMCFALYGETSGGERQIRHLRSDHADPGVRTEVCLDFSLGPERYRIFRSPEQDRPKKRGGGTTREPPRATLWRRTGVKGDGEDGVVVAERWSRVNEEIEHLLGFRSDQFRQVVVLPQGQFRRLLSSASAERQQILEVLFKTGLYRRIEEALKESAERAKNEVSALREKQRGILERLGAQTLTELAKQLADAVLEKKAVERAIRKRRQEAASAESELEKAREAARKLAELERAKTDLQSLEARKEEVQEKQKRLTLAGKARGLQELEREVLGREQEASQADKNVEAARCAFESARKEMIMADEALEKETSRQPERDIARTEADRLEALRPQIAELSKVRERFMELQRHVQALDSVREQSKSRLERSVDALQASQKCREEAVARAGQVEALEVAYHTLQRAYARLGLLEKLEKDRKTAKEAALHVQHRLKLAEEGRTAAEKELEQMEERWRKGQAAVLARQLEPGAPCPVCGSTEHPRPARDEGDVPTESDFQAARAPVKEMEEQLKRLQEEASANRDRVVRLESQIRAVEEELDALGETDRDGMKRRLDETKTRLDEARMAREGLAGLEMRIRKLEKEKARAEKEVERAESDFQRGVTDLAVAKSALEQSESRIPEPLRTMDGLEETIQKAREKSGGLEASFRRAQERQNHAQNALARAEVSLRNAEENAARANELAAKARRRFLLRLERDGFASEVEYRDSRMDEEALEQLDAEIQAFNGRLLEAKERLRRAAKEAERLKSPDLKPIEQRSAEIKRALEEALRRSGEVNKHIEQLAQGRRDVEAVDREAGEKEAHYGVVGRLADVASGKNAYNLTFERFVLATLLDDVLSEASVRLRMMSNGRFDLHRLAGLGDRRRAGGLDLMVYDAYTGTTRPVSTLSGGEGFLASLSMALGLADVVQSYAGGIKLDTIFIDEGFGSLDPESLDLALRALVDLQKGGRLVGIISHVPELRERVDVRLEISPGKRGSEARFVL